MGPALCGSCRTLWGGGPFSGTSQVSEAPTGAAVGCRHSRNTAGGFRGAFWGL